MASNLTWRSFGFQIPAQDLLEGVRGILETLLIFLEILKTILETVKIFLIDFGNPIKALVEILIKQILDLFESLKKTGFYGYYDIPDPVKDPNLLRQTGGYPAFIQRFKGSLVDGKDPNRPQPVSGLTKSGFLLFAVDSDNAFTLLRLIRTLLRFFGKELLSPQYGPPANVKALPVGSKGDPILALAKVFTDQPKAIAVEWSLPTNQQPPDPGFSDLIVTVGTEIIPPKFLIERAEIPVTNEIDIDQLLVADAAGIVTINYTTDFEANGKPGKKLKRTVRVTDEYGDPFIKFQKYTVVSTDSNTSTFILGQLGKFRYIDKDVQFDKVYRYRVRAFSGDLKIDGTTVEFDTPKRKDPNSDTWIIKWPGSDDAHPPTMGRGSGIVTARLAKIPANFDVIGALTALFQTAFSLNFHLPLSPNEKLDGNGDPIAPTTAASIGKGSLVKQASGIGGLTNLPFFGKSAAKALSPAEADPSQFGRNPINGKPLEHPWQIGSVRRQAARLTNTVASALLENGTGTIESFRTMMQGPLPSGGVSIKGFENSQTIEKLCKTLVEVQPDGTVSYAGSVRYGDAYADAIFRKNVLFAVNFVTSFTLGGVPPDWVRISLLRDVIPWSAKILYDLIAKIQALVDAFKGVMDEIIAFIDLLIRKIDILERFIQYLISLLDFVLSLQIGAYTLFLQETSGDVSQWFQLIDTAGGTKPPSGPGGFTCGVAIAYVAPDIGPLITPLKLIFGG
jgi:hypothetical protein